MQVTRLRRKAQLRRAHVFDDWLIDLDVDKIKRHAQKITEWRYGDGLFNLHLPSRFARKNHLHHLRIGKHLHRLSLFFAPPIDLGAPHVDCQPITQKVIHEREEAVLARYKIAQKLLYLSGVIIVTDINPRNIHGVICAREYLHERRHHPIYRRLYIPRHPIAKLREARELAAIIFFVRAVHIIATQKRRLYRRCVIVICHLTPRRERRHNLLDRVGIERFKTDLLRHSVLCRAIGGCVVLHHITSFHIDPARRIFPCRRAS